MTAAFLSVARKTDAFLEFAKTLYEREVSLFASSGTADFLKKKALPVQDTAQVIGPPQLGGRMKTLGGSQLFQMIYARRENASDRVLLDLLGLPELDLVCVVPYPLEEAISDMAYSVEDVMEMIDVGGSALLMAAAKAGRLVVGREEDFPSFTSLIEDVKDWDEISTATRHLLARQACQVVLRHVAQQVRLYEMLYHDTFPTWRNAPYERMYAT